MIYYIFILIHVFQYYSYYYCTIIKYIWAEVRPEVTAEEREKVNILYVFNHLCIFIYIYILSTWAEARPEVTAEERETVNIYRF